ncbi:aspartic proteinase nepenthesin-1-like [Elaeis guineensis]|uniref:aspartic proteinase nepenthesin-1-like n=1 Tax=Elaeis guineensis var. tenera TaxID=51953 RepID=UPI003C6D6FBB
MLALPLTRPMFRSTLRAILHGSYATLVMTVTTDDLPFDPSQSVTYESLKLCSPFLCTKEYYLHGTADNKCMFIIHYHDGSLVCGGVATETLHISNNNGAFHNTSTIIFGCVHFDKKFYEATANGIFGLGRGSLSILSQSSMDKFSCCLTPPYFEGYHPIRFGSEPNITGGGAMFLAPVNKFNYILMLEGINFGSQSLPIEVPGLYFGMFIDTGSTLTYLNPLGFAPLLKALDEVISPRKYKATKVLGENCCLGSLEDVAGFNVTFNFMPMLMSPCPKGYSTLLVFMFALAYYSSQMGVQKSTLF